MFAHAYLVDSHASHTCCALELVGCCGMSPQCFASLQLAARVIGVFDFPSEIRQLLPRLRENVGGGGGTCGSWPCLKHIGPASKKDDSE